MEVLVRKKVNDVLQSKTSSKSLLKEKENEIHKISPTVILRYHYKLKTVL